jgi:O-methyltransferase
MLRGLFTLIVNPRARRDWRFIVLRKLGKWLIPEYRFLWPQMVWWQDESFNEYLKRFQEFDGCNSDRRWMVSQLAKLAESVPGDTAECGVLAGSSSYLICRAFPDRTHFMFDSFAGLSEPAARDGDYFEKNDLGCSVETVKENLKQFTNTSYHKGWIPERFKDIESKRFAFVHIDVQLYQPTRDSFEFFYPRMNKGGIILCDDYGFSTCPGAKQAVDEFLAGKPEKIIWLSGSSAFIVKA